VPLPSASKILHDGHAVLRARWYLRHATEVGDRVRLWGTPTISNRGTFKVGDRVRLVSTVTRLEIAVGPDATLEIGESTFINHGCSIGVTQHVRIGANCSIGPQVYIMDNDFHRLEPDRRNELPPSLPIVLEDNVWLAARVTVLPGVTIGAGSVIGASSVVVRDVPPRSLAAGVPARVIRNL